MWVGTTVDGPGAYEVGDQARHRAMFELLVERLIRWLACGT